MKINWPQVAVVVLGRWMWIAGAALFGFLFFQEWSAHRATAKAQAAAYTTVETRESVKWQRITAECPEAGGAVQVVTKISKEEVERLAREYGLVLRETRTVEGPTRVVTVPVFTDESGRLLRLLGEKELRALPWGGRALGSLDDDGAFGLDVKPTPEPFTEKLSQWVLYGGIYYGAADDPNLGAESGLGGEIGAGFVWRRFGRWELEPNAVVGYTAWKGVEGRIGLRLAHRELPLRLRATNH